MSKQDLYLFFDTETTGLPSNWKAPVTDTDNWPRIVQIAWILSTNKSGRIESKDYIIKPEGFTIPAESSNVHGISTEKALAEGVPLGYVLLDFERAMKDADFIVAHNISFDEKVLGAEFIRLSMNNDFFEKNRLCTMQSSTQYCQLPGRYGYKWPTLSELHNVLFGKDFNDAHNAAGDINATENCFWKLRELKLI